jgi:hypothetical protein
MSDLDPGERVEVTVSAVNSLSAGRYYVGCTLVRGTAGLDIMLHHERAIDLVSYGADLVGLVGLEYQTNVIRAGSSQTVSK